MCVSQHLMCAGLWCLVEGDSSCKTKLDPPLDGTECGADKVELPERHTPVKLKPEGATISFKGIVNPPQKSHYRLTLVLMNTLWGSFYSS